MVHTVKEFGDIFIEIWKIELDYDGYNLHMWKGKKDISCVWFLLNPTPNQLYSTFIVSMISFSHTCFGNWHLFLYIQKVSVLVL